jgi:hypothetical protein
MLRPLGGTLQFFHVLSAPRVNARVVLVLQSLLPQLHVVWLQACGKQLPLMPAGSQAEQEQQALDSVKQLLRPGLDTVVLEDLPE